MNTLPANLDWSAADAAYTGMRDQYLAFCAALGQLSHAGATQHQIAERYDISQGAVAKAIAIGRDTRIIRNANNMPKSSETLYLMTSLDEATFNTFASPDTTRQMLLDHRDKDKAPKAPRDPFKPYNDMLEEINSLKADLAVSEAEVDKYLNQCIEYEDEIENLKAENDSLKGQIAILNDELTKALGAKPKAKVAKPKPLKTKGVEAAS